VDRDLLASGTFIHGLPDAERERFVSVGRYALRGVRRPQELFTLGSEAPPRGVGDTNPLEAHNRRKTSCSVRKATLLRHSVLPALYPFTGNYRCFSQPSATRCGIPLQPIGKDAVECFALDGGIADLQSACRGLCRCTVA